MAARITPIVNGGLTPPNRMIAHQHERLVVYADAVLAPLARAREPLCGLCSEVAARALSPGVNDPGTAILVVDSAYRVLEDWIADSQAPDVEPTFDRIRAFDLDGCAMIEQSLGEVARFGAGDVAVAVRVQRALQALARAGGGELAECARAQAKVALDRAEQALALEIDRDRVRTAGEA